MPKHIRINCGSDETRGINFVKDTGFTTGLVATFGDKALQSTPTLDPIIFHTMRVGPAAYNIPLDNGAYTVKLYFMETSGLVTKAGDRLFDVTMQGATKLENFDIFVAAKGRWKPITRTFKGIEVTNGNLNISFVDKKDLAVISAIEVVIEKAYDFNNRYTDITTDATITSGTTGGTTGGGGTTTPPPTTTPTPTPNSAVVKKSGFQVVGTKIYDPQGKEFIVKGVNVNGYNWMWDRDVTVDAESIVDVWKFNMIRVCCLIMPDSLPEVSFKKDNNDFEKIVHAFTSKGCVVMFEAHDRTGRYFEGADLTTLVNWHKDLATRFKDNPYVWYNVMNEPGDLIPQKWLDVHRAVIKGIRDDVQSDAIIICDGWVYGQDLGYLDDAATVVPEANSAIISLGQQVLTFDGKTYPNIIFSAHVYELYNPQPARVVDYVNKVAAKNLCLIFGEYGSYNNSSTLPGTNNMFAAAVPRNIGRAVWAWYGADTNDLTTTTNGGGFYVNSLTAPTNLTALGQICWDDNHRTETLAQLSDVNGVLFPAPKPLPKTIIAPPEILLINCGGRASRDLIGVPEEGYVNGGHKTDPNLTTAITDIPGMLHPSVYRTQHWGNQLYTIPLPNATYVVRIHYIQTVSYMGAGMEIQSLAIQGTTVLSNHDTWATAGKLGVPVIKSYEATVTNNVLIIEAKKEASSSQEAALAAIEILPKRLFTP